MCDTHRRARYYNLMNPSGRTFLSCIEKICQEFTDRLSNDTRQKTLGRQKQNSFLCLLFCHVLTYLDTMCCVKKLFKLNCKIKVIDVYLKIRIHMILFFRNNIHFFQICSLQQNKKLSSGLQQTSQKNPYIIIIYI